jgi:hypothetical protein
MAKGNQSSTQLGMKTRAFEKVKLCKKRAIVAGNRLKKLDASLWAKKQQRQRKAPLQGNSAHNRAPS